MSDGEAILNSRKIAEEIIEKSPSVAMRVSGDVEKRKTLFITKNISKYGYNRDDFLSGKLSWMDVIHPDDRGDLVNLFYGFAEMGNDKYSVVYRIVRADGAPVWISDTSIVVRDESGAISHTDCIISDYTETKQNIESIGENVRQQAILNEILQGMHDADLDKSIQLLLDRSGSYLDVSRVVLFQISRKDPRLCRPIHEWRNHGVPALVGGDEANLDELYAAPGMLAELAAYGYRIVDHRDGANECPPDAPSSAAVFSVNIQGKPFGFISFEEHDKDRHWSRETIRFLDNVSRLASPVILRRQNEQIIQSLALTDQLTGLNNRHHLDTCLNRAIEQARQAGQFGYVLFIDMDDFKIINDAYGHDYGDAILREVSHFLKSYFGDESNVFRFGGDEFVILVPPNRANDIYDIMNGLLTRARLPWTVFERTFYCTLSLGVVRFPIGREDSREIIKNADIAMYQAKKTGKNNYVFYTNTLDRDSVERAELETAMRESIENGFEGFEIQYQPISNTDRRIVGAEALVRWTPPNGQLMAPAQFIPLTEYLGLIIPIGEYVLRSGADFCKTANQIDPDFFVSVNVSVRQFKQQEFIENTLQILSQTNVRRSNIILEITEGMAIHDMQGMKLIAGVLRNSGIRIAMDDFGIGYSSLGSMRDLPVDVVKIDRSFIQGVTTDSYSKSFIRFITDLVHSMGRKVCIEGVESELQFEYSRECGADSVQGYYLWRPMPRGDFLEILARENSDAALPRA